jgi:tetratricopeptide (TPR) repeat protein
MIDINYLPELIKAKEYEEAISLLSGFLLQTEYSNLELVIDLKELYILTDNRIEAINLLQRYLELYPLSSKCNFELAVLYYMGGEFELALKFFEAAYSLNKGDIDALFGCYICKLLLQYNLNELLVSLDQSMTEYLVEDKLLYLKAIILKELGMSEVYDIVLAELSMVNPGLVPMLEDTVQLNANSALNSLLLREKS